jgi:hypothetical protein
MKVINNQKCLVPPKPKVGQVVEYSGAYYLIVDGANEYVACAGWPYVAICISAPQPYLTKLNLTDLCNYTVYEKAHIVID